MEKITNQQLVEVDISELIYRLLSQWKAILIVSLLMAALLCGVKHSKDVKAYNAEQEAAKEAAAQLELTEEERVETVLAALPEAERQDVRYLYQEKKWAVEQKEYLEKSILMNTDPTNQRVLKQVYVISSDEPSDLAVLLHDYAVYLYSDEVCEAIKPYIDPESEDRYIKELFYDEDYENVDTEISGTKAALDVNLVLTEDADASGVSDALSKVLSKHCSEIQAIYPHSIMMTASEDARLHHKNNAEKIRSAFNSANNMESNIKTSEANLSENQAAAWASIKEIMDSSAVEDAAAETVETAAPGFSKKYAVLGFILGVFVYACAYIIALIIKGTTVSASSLKKSADIRFLGSAYYDGKERGIRKLLQSRLVNKLYGRDADSYDAQIEKIKGTIDAVCRHRGADNVTYIDSVVVSDESAKDKLLAALTDCSGIESGVIEAGNDPDGFREEQLLTVKNAVILAGDNTKAETFCKLASLCREYDIDLLGSVYVARV